MFNPCYTKGNTVEERQLAAVVNPTILDKTFVDFFTFFFFRLFQFLFITSETELDYYYQKVNVRVASWAPERLKTKEIRN